MSMYVGASRSYKTKCDRILKKYYLMFLTDMLMMIFYFVLLKLSKLFEFGIAYEKILYKK